MPLFRRRAARPAGPPAAPADPAATQRLDPVGAGYQVHEEIAESPPPPPRIWPWLLALLVLVAAGLGGLYALTRDDGDDSAAATPPPTAVQVQVPDVEGQQLDEATAALVDAGLRARVVQRASEEREDVVLEQDPAAGASVARGTAVTVTVAGSEGTVAVPDVRGLPAARAFVRLDDAGLKPQSKRALAQAPAGEVVSQKPAPGTKVARGSTIVLSVSRGGGEVEVPDVSGGSESEAVAALDEAGLEAAVERVPSAEPEGMVVAQSPGAGERVARGSVVRINVSGGSAATGTVTVPDVVGLSQAAAAGRLRAAGLTVEANPVESTEPKGRVIRQSPASGSRRSRGAVVRIDVSDGAEVPSVVGDDEATATGRLEQAGFTVQVETVETTDPGEDGIVLSQSPSAGERVAAGGRVTITVGTLTG